MSKFIDRLRVRAAKALMLAGFSRWESSQALSLDGPLLEEAETFVQTRQGAVAPPPNRVFGYFINDKRYTEQIFSYMKETLGEVWVRKILELPVGDVPEEMEEDLFRLHAALRFLLLEAEGEKCAVANRLKELEANGVRNASLSRSKGDSNIY